MPIIEKDCDVIYKVLIVGDSGVGKTAILDCLMGRDFNENSKPTVGVDFVRKIVEADGALVQLRIWDTAGLEKFRSITRLQYRGVQGLIVVYDVTDETSFHSVAYWLSNIQHNRGPSRHPYEPIPFLVVGNKSDVISEKKVSSRQGLKLAKKEMAFGFYEISAKTGENVFKAFHSLAYHITDITNPKLMKSYHPNFIRPRGVKPDMSSELNNLNRLSAPQFSSASSSSSSFPTPSPSASSRQRYSLWDPLIPWASYDPSSARTLPQKTKVKRLKFTFPLFKKKKKKASSSNGAKNDVVLRSSSKSRTHAFDPRDPSGSRPNKSSRRHEKKRFKRFFHSRKRSNLDKRTSKRKQRQSNGQVTAIKRKSVKRRFNVKDAEDGHGQSSSYRLRAVKFRTRLVHFLCSCFTKQNTA